ncbi:MAG: hypothetical protein V1820_02215 [archaeon]
MAYTTIQILAETREKLSKLKGSKRETYDELLNKLVSLVPAGDEEGEYTEDFRIGILNARIQLRRKEETHTQEEAKRKLGI